MKKLDSNHKIFFELLKAGLLGDGNPDKRIDGTTDWNCLYQLAQEQSVQGIVLQGIERFRIHDSGFKIPKVLLLQWIGEVQVIEQRNKEMNAFVAELIGKLRKAGIYALLVKGQGIAQCYDRPFWRACGDVDFLLDDENYEKGKKFLSGIAQEVHKENDFDNHFSVILDGWDVELHGSMRSMLAKKTDALIDEIQKEAFEQNRYRVWNNNGTEILLPSSDDDVIIVFTHILKHFFHYGIGLRQVCDWCRLIYTYRDSLNYELLESRLRKMGLISEWKVFGSLAVHHLGMPKAFMPFYSPNKSYKKKADRVLAFILETGNFGHNRDHSRYAHSSKLVQRLGSLWQHTCDSLRHSFIFPTDSVRIWGRMFIFGISDALKGK